MKTMDHKQILKKKKDISERPARSHNRSYDAAFLDSLKDKGFFEGRKNALEKYDGMRQEDIIHESHIRTGFNIDFDKKLLKEGKTEYVFDKNFKRYKVSILQLSDFIKNNLDKDNSWIIESLMKTEHVRLMKLDYLHLGLSDIKIIVIEAGQKIPDTLLIDRKVTGNNYNHLVFWIKSDVKVTIMLRTSIKDPDTRTDDAKVNPASKEDKRIKMIHRIHKDLLITDFVDVFSEDGSSLCLIEEKSLDDTYTNYSKKFGHLKDDARIDWITVDKDNKLSYTEHHMKLLGKNSRSNINTIFCGKDSEYVTYTLSEHFGKGSESLIQQRGVLRGSKAIIKGLIRINPEASQSNSYQKSDILLIDDKSRAISIPNLQIYNNDVKCSHGATISRLDDEKIFYIQSRGFNDIEASKIVITGFFNKLLSIIPDENLRDMINSDIMGEYDE